MRPIPQPDPTVVVHTTCRACPESDLVEVFDLGHLYLSDFPAAAGLSPAHPRVPLTLMACPACHLVQTQHTAPFSWMFGEQYWYRSGVNEAMQAELADVARDGARRVGGLGKSDYVLDIGANDGTLLATYGRWVAGGPIRVAFEPSRSVYPALRPHTDVLYADPFPPTAPVVKGELLQQAGTFKVITAIAMAYDLEDPHAFFKALGELLHPEGVAILQFQDLLGMIHQTAFDTICHEHLEYYSLWALAEILYPHDLWIVDVTPRAINGGSLRVVVKHREVRLGYDAMPGLERVTAHLLTETDSGVVTNLPAVFAGFARRVGDVTKQIRGTLDSVLSTGGLIDLYGASTKGNTLLQVLGVDQQVIRQAIERSPEKWGRVVGQTGIPIVSELAGRVNPADLWLVPLWQFKPGILVREAQYIAAGGALVFPLPYTEIVVGAGVGAVA